MQKAIAVKVNKSGIKYALIAEDCGFAVWKLCENYAPHRKGGMSQTWRVVESKMTREAADKLYSRRSK